MRVNGARFALRAGRLLACAILGLACACARSWSGRILPPSQAGRPYVSLYDQVGDIRVWIVNGQYVRELLDEEFTNFGQHYSFRFIPDREFWLDQQNAPGEERLFVLHLTIEHKLMAQEIVYDRALERADALEQEERGRTPLGREGNELLKSNRRAELIDRIHKIPLDAYSRHLRVWIVDGEMVRSVFFIDFTEGGHDKVYDFVPAGEVWIDDDVKPGERKFILLHELHERRLMANGWRYPRAHRDSSRIERLCRRNPETLDRMLEREIARNP